MKTLFGQRKVAIWIGVGAVVAAASTLTAAKAKKLTAEEVLGEPASRYDANDNGLLEKEERGALAKAFAEGVDPALKRYDLDGDGQLTDEEIAKIKLPPDGPGAGKKNKKEKKEKKG